MAGHAKLSPSASHRWMNCPGSVALIGDESSSTNSAAMLGTAAHKLIETMIIADEHDCTRYAGYVILVKDAGDEETEIYEPGTPLDLAARTGWFMFIVDEKMIEGCQQTIDEVDRIKDTRMNPEVHSEHYLDMTWLDSRLGGTADITIVEPFGWADLVDHKNGKIIVEAKDNDQLKQYAVGVLHEHPDVEGVTVTISQPHSPHIEGLIRSDSFTRDELKLYEIRMKEAADATSAPNAPRRVGDWCTWCSAKTRCVEFLKSIEEEARMEFADDDIPTSLPTPETAADLVRLAKWVPLFQALSRQVLADIQRELENGNKVEGWKLVRGRAKRLFKDPLAVQQRLTMEVEGEDFVGLDDADIWVAPKLKTPAQMEKLGVGKEQRKLVKKVVKELASMPDGRLTIAEITDPREEALPGEDAFDEFDDEDNEDFV